MLAVASPDICFPETPRHLLRTDISPSKGNISFVGYLIQNAGFTILNPPLICVFGSTVSVNPLNAAVRNPWSCMVIHGHAVMNRPQMPVRILPADHCGIRFPLTDRFVRIDIIFIRHRPPDIVKSAEAVHDIFDIEVLLFLCHVCIPPTVIGMQKDQIRLDPHLSQTYNILLDLRKIGRIEPMEIPDLFRVSNRRRYGSQFIPGHGFQFFFVKIIRTPGCILSEFKRIHLRLTEIVVVMLRENAEAQLIKRQLFKTSIGIPPHLFRLQMPDVTGRSYRIKDFSVVIAEMILRSYPHRSVVTFLCFPDRNTGIWKPRN